MTDRTNEFFAFARERHASYLRRRAGRPWPWSDDSVLQRYRFTNVFRELDRTTHWFREHVRDPLRSEPEVLLATVLFRWFNRITTGEAIFSQNMLDLGTSPGFGADGLTPWEAREGYGEDVVAWISALRASVTAYCGHGPYVTGAYIIKTPDGMSKLDGVLWCVEQFMMQERDYPGDVATAALDWRGVAGMLINQREWEPEARYGSLEQTWHWLRKFPYMGDFMAYEVVTDLRHTALLDWAPDIMAWANPGPGATRGLGRVLWEDPKHYSAGRDRAELILRMRELLAASQDAGYWPQVMQDEIQVSDRYLARQHGVRRLGDLEQSLLRPEYWPRWEMREVEHTCCEADKWWRAREGGKMKRRYEP